MSRNPGVNDTMAELPINEDLIRDLLCRLASSDEEEREAAAEALAISTEDWRPHELIRQALWLLVPGGEDVVTSEPQDEYE
jgi:hypothetical protein